MKKQVLIFRLIIIIHCVYQTEIRTQNVEEKIDTWLIVFIHGIISIKPYLNLPNMVRFIRDRIAQTSYERTIELTRRDDFFYQHHPMQKPGLRNISMSDTTPGAASTAYAHIFEKIYEFCGIHQKNYYYTFGWSGLLSPRIRHFEAKILYDQLIQVYQEFKDQGIKPKICLICYSHGGNIALKLGEVYKTEGYPKSKKLPIDQLILYGLPVLPETDYLVNSSLFKKVYHVYSFGDRVQRLDLFSLSRISSNRIFHERSDFKIPKKLVQIELRIRRPITGKERIASSPEELINILHNRRIMRNADPGHSEFWSFGWAPSSYRPTFPFYPLPAAVLTPFLTHTIESKHPEATKLIMELHPFYERMLCYDIEKRSQQLLPFMTRQQVDTLKVLALQYRPLGYSREMYNQKITYAKVKARDEWLTNRNIRRFGRFKRFSVA